HSPLVISGEVRFAAAAATTGDVTITGTFQAPSASGSLLVSGNWLKTGGSFNPNGGTVTFTAPALQTVNSGGAAFNNVAHPGAGILRRVGSDLTINGTLTNAAGVFELNGQNLSMSGAAGNFSNTAVVRLQGGETISGLTQD